MQGSQSRASSLLENDEQGNSAYGDNGVGPFWIWAFPAVRTPSYPRSSGQASQSTGGGCDQHQECWRRTLLIQHRRGCLEFVVYGEARGCQRGSHEVCSVRGRHGRDGVYSAICPRRGSWNRRRWICKHGSVVSQANPQQPPDPEHLTIDSVHHRAEPFSETKKSTFLKNRCGTSRGAGADRTSVGGDVVCWQCSYPELVVLLVVSCR